MNHEAIQVRLTEVARVEYEKGGTEFPPGIFMHFMSRSLSLIQIYLQKHIQDSRTLEQSFLNWRVAASEFVPFQEARYSPIYFSFVEFCVL